MINNPRIDDLIDEMSKSTKLLESLTQQLNVVAVAALKTPGPAKENLNLLLIELQEERTSLEKRLDILDDALEAAINPYFDNEEDSETPEA